MTVRVNPEEAEVVEVSDEGTTYMARDEATGEMMMAVVPGDIPGGIVAEQEMDHPMSSGNRLRKSVLRRAHEHD